MNESARRAWIAVLWIAPVALLTLFASRDPRGAPVSADAAPELPLVLDDWAGREVEVTERTLSLLGTDRVLNREYRDPAGARVHVCVVRARDRRTSFHPPEVCYRGWGYEVEEQATVEVPTSGGGFEANVLRLAKPDKRVLAVYWYRFGGRRTTSFLEQQVRLTLRLPFAGGSGDGSLVRLSTRIDPAEEGAEARALIRVVDLASRIAGHEASDVEKTRHRAAE